jgi:creatinine deaminase
LLGSGHNRRVQEDDASVHAETDAFRKGGRRRDYPDTVMVTTLSPCWYCSGSCDSSTSAPWSLARRRTSTGARLARGARRRDHVLDDPACTELLGTFILEHPELWNEDIGL